jgi:23S rRNA (cytosine1962-C5)-methyltransferase
MTATVRISAKGADRARARHCWIYRSDLLETSNTQPGAVVRITGPGGEVLGSALYSSRSQIALRVVSFDAGAIDAEFWRSRLIAAENLRERVVRDRTAYRLVYGESDLLPSLIVDRYGDCLVIQTLSQGMDALKQMWIEMLAERYSPRAIVERNEARVRELEGLPRQAHFVCGQVPSEMIIEEQGVKMSIDLVRGQKTGSFLDQSENRIASERYARGRALDCFTFQGGFALHLAGGADRVIAIDSSDAAIAGARRNAEINGLANIDFVQGNVFDILHEMESAGERFDTIVLDPPAFAKNRGSVEAARRGYKEINLRAIKLLTSGGTLITSTCSYHISEIEFLNLISEAAADAHRSVRLLEKRMQSRDHPVLISMPETYYLKCMILSVE